MLRFIFGSIPNHTKSIFKGSPPVLIFDGLFIISWWFLILLVILIIFGPYIMVLKSRDHGEIGLWTCTRVDTYKKFRKFLTFESRWLGTNNSAKWSSCNAASKKYKRNNFDSHIMAPESSKVPKLGHFFSKQGNFFSGNRIDKKLLNFLDEGPFYYLQ